MNKLYRSRRDKMITGLCAGLAKWLNVDVTLIRIIVVITAIFSTGAPVIFIYIVASLVIPKEPNFDSTYPYGSAGASYKEQPPFGGGYQPPTGGYQPYNGGPSSYGTPNVAPNPPKTQSTRDELDEMMKEVEKKALRKEIDELRAKLDKYEKGDV